MFYFRKWNRLRRLALFYELAALCRLYLLSEMEEVNKLVEYSGGCHCGKVKFRALAPQHLVAWSCNCSICNMRRNDHIVVPESHFTLDESSREFLTEYTFNTHTAKHTFCKVCGITSFYRPRSNPDGLGITLYCLTEPAPLSVEIKNFDGENWEDFIEGSGIREHSKS